MTDFTPSVSQDELVRFRREFHRHAESGFSEFWTTARLAAELSKAGYDVQVGDSVIKRGARLGVPDEKTQEARLEAALAQGADLESAEATGIVRGENGIFTVLTGGDSWLCRSVILATGAKHRTLGLEGEEELIGNGISFCAVCDGAFYRGKRVAVVGGGNSALQETLLLAELCE